MDKVILPRKVAEALEKVKENTSDDEEFIAWCIPDEKCAKKREEFWKVLHEYGSAKGNFFKLIDALRYGYEIELEPITITITPQMQIALRRIYEHLRFFERVGFERVLSALDLKIPGVNA